MKNNSVYFNVAHWLQEESWRSLLQHNLTICYVSRDAAQKTLATVRGWSGVAFRDDGRSSVCGSKLALAARAKNGRALESNRWLPHARLSMPGWRRTVCRSSLFSYWR